MEHIVIGVDVCDLVLGLEGLSLINAFILLIYIEIDRFRTYFNMEWLSGVDCFYLIQAYSRVHNHLLRDNAGKSVLFKQDKVYLKHLYQKDVNTDMNYNKFKELCYKC